MENIEEAVNEISPQANETTAISHVEVHDVVGVIILGILAILCLIFWKKSQDRYTELVNRYLAERG